METRICRRCGPNIPFEVNGYAVCSVCEQYLTPFPASINSIDSSPSAQQDDQEFAAPYTYNRALITVPGVPYLVPNLACINQSVVDYIREKFIPRDDDIWLATYPKAGTTWMQNILSYILYNEPNTSNGISVGLTPDENIVWFEAQCIPGGSGSTQQTVEDDAEKNLFRVNSNPKRRCFKSHSHLGILEPLITSNGKIIHVARNPRDISVSMWHHTRSKSFGYTGPFNHFVSKLFLPGHVESGSWWDFVIPYCKATKRWKSYSETQSNSTNTSKNYTQIMTIWYEDIKENPIEIILQVAQFINVELTRDQAENIAQACSLEVMKEAEQSAGLKLSTRVVIGKKETEQGGNGNIDEVCSNHIREGKVGGWKKYFTTELLEEFNLHHHRECQRYHLIENDDILPPWILHLEE